METHPLLHLVLAMGVNLVSRGSVSFLLKSMMIIKLRRRISAVHHRCTGDTLEAV